MDRRCAAVVIAALMLRSVAPAQDGGIEWSESLSAAFAQAKAQQKILMICVNAKHVDGRTTEEPAAKGLREVVYKDARVVAKSREFVCAFLTPESSATEYDELRPLGISGTLISPQHIFLHPDGTRVLLREQYWPHGKGDAAVEALIGMMERAQAALADEAAKIPPPSDDRRGEWIAERIREVVEATQTTTRDAAVGALVAHDRDGDCTQPLLALLDEHPKRTGLLAEILRSLGRDQWLFAAPAVAEFLTHREDALRGMAAVSLEYIGSTDKDVAGALRAAAGRERDEAIANHMYRALGRCAAGDARTCALLLKECDSAKSEFASFGPAIGLAYFEGDRKAARGVEKILAKLGAPGGRRGGGANALKRGVLCWTLAMIGDPRSGAFVREELMPRLENVKAWWVEGVHAFYAQTARACDKEEGAMAGVVAGVQRIAAFGRGADPDGAEARDLMDDYRKNRAHGGFTPKGDDLFGSR